MAPSHGSVKMPCNQSDSNRQFILFSDFDVSASERSEGVVSCSTVVRSDFTHGHYVFFFFWDGLHVQHEVEVKGGCGRQRDHSAAVFTSDEEISNAAYLS